MNIEIFEHEILGEMHVFGNEQGLWFSFVDVYKCLEIENPTASKKFKFLNSDLKQIVKCSLNGEERETNHKFVHEKAVYQFMCMGTSKYCLQFQEWVSNIAYEFNILNIRSCDSYLTDDFQSDFDFVKTYIDNIYDDSPVTEAAKNAMNNLDEAFKDNFKTITERSIFNKENSYRNDYTRCEASEEPYYKSNLSKEEIEELKNISEEDYKRYFDYDEWDEELILDAHAEDTVRCIHEKKDGSRVVYEKEDGYVRKRIYR